jgi:hypothetical protein
MDGLEARPLIPRGGARAKNEFVAAIERIRAGARK